MAFNCLLHYSAIHLNTPSYHNSSHSSSSHSITHPPSSSSFSPLSEFCELRPGLIGWLIINLGMAYKQYTLRKTRSLSGRGSISMSMLLVTLFQGFYVWDALYMEKVSPSPFSSLSPLCPFHCRRSSSFFQL